jgi:hypothetical protein
MEDGLNLLGMLISKGKIDRSLGLHSSGEIVEFLKENLFQEWGGVSTDRVVIIDQSGMRPIFEAIGGVDMYSELQKYGVDLPQIYRDINKQQSEQLAELSRDESATDPNEDSIGLSASEVVMRKETLRSARAAKTVNDVAQLVKDTYFDAWFKTTSGDRSWSYFDPEACSVRPMMSTGGGWSANPCEKRIVLNGSARVEFNGSGEDIVSFIILDPPS